MQLGCALIPGFHLHLSLEAMLKFLATDPFGAIHTLWGASWRGMLAWLLVAPPGTVLIAALLRPVFQSVATRWQRSGL